MRRINPEAPLTPQQKNRRYYVAHKDEVNEKNKSYQQNNREKIHARHRNNRHRIDQQWFDDKKEEQNNRCALCEEEFKQTPHIDHDHKCCPPLRSCDKCRRDLLCKDCNLGLGRFKDSVTLLGNAIQYLERHMK